MSTRKGLTKPQKALLLRVEAQVLLYVADHYPPKQALMRLNLIEDQLHGRVMLTAKGAALADELIAKGRAV